MPNTSGFTALLSIIIIVSVALMISLSVNMSGMNQLQDTMTQTFSSEAFSFADSCIEEGMVRLKRDAHYPGGSLTINNIACEIQITELNDNQYQISADALSENNYYRHIDAVITITLNGLARNIIINSWQES
jgi:hypothetical protein